jgi:hypothetical protein
VGKAEAKVETELKGGSFSASSELFTVIMQSQTSSNHFTLQTIRDLREVENLREVWKSWQKTRDSDLDFFSGMVRSRGDGCTPHVVVLSRNSRPDALLVGFIERRKVPVRVASVTIYRPTVTVLEFVYGGLLGNASKENCTALVQAVKQSLADGYADVALWEHLDVHSELYTCALQLPSAVLRDHSGRLSEHWFMNFPHGLEAFLLTLGPRRRSQLRRKYKRVLNSFAGRIQVRSFRAVADLEQAIPDMEKIARHSTKRHLGYGFFDTAQTREQLLLEARRGWLRIYILYIDGNPVSFLKGTLYEGCLQPDHTAFDSAWSAFSPGIFLFFDILEKLHDEDVKTIDFGCGNGQLYQCFGNMHFPEARVRICAPKFRALQFHLLRDLAHYVTLLIRGTPSLSGARRILWKKRQAASLARHGSGLDEAAHGSEEGEFRESLS